MSKPLLTLEQYHAARRRREIFDLLMVAIFDLIGFVFVGGLGALLATLWLMDQVGLWAVSWAGITGALCCGAFCIGCAWHRFKDWLL